MLTILFCSLLKLQVAASIYTPETVSALNKYRQHLGRVWELLRERRKRAIQELRAYGDNDNVDLKEEGHEDDRDDGSGTDFGDRGPMREIARRYGDLVADIETVKAEIRRLEE